jgi:hypothetical protein
LSYRSRFWAGIYDLPIHVKRFGYVGISLEQ